MNILAFSTSNSKKSINKQLVTYAISQLSAYSAEIIDLNDYEMPIYNIDLEEAHGIPKAAHTLREKFGEADAILISFAEHNGSYTAVYKNTMDWLSRIDRNIFQNKDMLLLATSPGPGGASNVLKQAIGSAPFFGGEIKGSFSLPSFSDNFDQDKKVISDTELNEAFLASISKLVN